MVTGDLAAVLNERGILQHAPKANGQASLLACISLAYRKRRGDVQPPWPDQ